MRHLVRRLLVLGLLLTSAGSCRSSKKTAPAEAASGTTSSGVAAEPPWDATASAPTAPKGMVWIPPGALVAGTPRHVLPRIADEEMAGEQVILSGFFIEIYPYPNEEGAIPLASVTQEEAAGLCAERGRRLCSELEWERACKGPKNTIYEYGNAYRPEICGTGAEARLLPSGYRVSCRSEFGVRDMHGGLWEWTSSPWGRGVKANLVTVRGGNAPAGELVGRCSNAMGRPPGSRSGTVGFRCCSGPQNDAEVVLHVERGPSLQLKDPVDKKVAQALEQALPEAASENLPSAAPFRITRTWLWRPIGNEELVVAGGCAGAAPRRRCGVVVARMILDRPDVLAWASSGHFPPTVKIEGSARDLWVYGGDDRSHYRRLVVYAWGRVNIGELERNPKGGSRAARRVGKRK